MTALASDWLTHFDSPWQVLRGFQRNWTGNSSELVHVRARVCVFSGQSVNKECIVLIIRN